MLETKLYREIDSTDSVHRLVTPLITVRGDKEEYASGTAFVIGPGWALTAHHVLDDFLHRYQDPQNPSGATDITFDMFGYLALNEVDRLPIKFLRSWMSAGIDIAVLRFGGLGNKFKNHKWTVPILDLFPPHIETPIAAVGFPGSHISRVTSAAIAELVVNPMMSTGRVKEVHCDRRDTVRLSFPCFRTDARFDGGMSGGPVFNLDTGHVCGVVCSSMDLGSEQIDHVSYASSLWPVMATVVDAPDDGISGAEPFPFVDLFHRRLLLANGLDRISVESAFNGLFKVSAKKDAT